LLLPTGHHFHTKSGQLLSFSKKLTEVNYRPIGETWPDLVTLITALENRKVGSLSSAKKFAKANSIRNGALYVRV
jgi:hypothetical protein